MVSTGEFYGGSRLLSGLVDIVGLPIDQVNFLVCQIVALVFAFPFRKYCSPATCSTTTRHVIELVVGVSLAYFCFGYQIYHLFVLSFVCYLLMMTGQEWMHKAVFVFVMTYLSITHMFRQIYDYGGYTLDITGPMMIMVQKLTSFVFAYHDGSIKTDDKLTPEQKTMAIRKLPDLLAFLSYLFYFHGIMCGPFSFYSDYLAFIEGRNFSDAKKPGLQNGNADSQVCLNEPESPNSVVVQKLMSTLFFGIVMVTLIPLYTPDYLLGDEYNACSFITRHFYLVVIITLVRSKYYFAWKLGESINNAAGLGFQGYDKNGKPKWDLVNNVDIIELETCTSLKINIESWNKTSNRWLRMVVYDRATKFRTLSVFTCSAIWHGFYPGYYVTFATGALFTLAARLVRRRIRPFFQTSESFKTFYNAFTFVGTRVANVIMCGPFTVLQLLPSILLLSSIFWWMHISAVLAIVYFNYINPPKKEEKKMQ